MVNGCITRKDLRDLRMKTDAGLLALRRSATNLHLCNAHPQQLGSAVCALPHTIGITAPDPRLAPLVQGNYILDADSTANNATWSMCTSTYHGSHARPIGPPRSHEELSMVTLKRERQQHGADWVWVWTLSSLYSAITPAVLTYTQSAQNGCPPSSSVNIAGDTWAVAPPGQSCHTQLKPTNRLYTLAEAGCQERTSQNSCDGSAGSPSGCDQAGSSCTRGSCCGDLHCGCRYAPPCKVIDQTCGAPSGCDKPRQSCTEGSCCDGAYCGCRNGDYPCAEKTCILGPPPRCVPEGKYCAHTADCCPHQNMTCAVAQDGQGTVCRQADNMGHDAKKCKWRTSIFDGYLIVNMKPVDNAAQACTYIPHPRIYSPVLSMSLTGGGAGKCSNNPKTCNPPHRTDGCTSQNVTARRTDVGNPHWVYSQSGPLCAYTGASCGYTWDGSKYAAAILQKGTISYGSAVTNGASTATASGADQPTRYCKIERAT